MSNGCNTCSGTYMVDGEPLPFGSLAGTKMACADGIRVQQAAVLAAKAQSLGA